MTSIPPARRARAISFAPRSCPSKPGLATKTLIFLSPMLQPPLGDGRTLLIFTEYLPQAISDLTQGDIALNRLEDIRPKVLRALSRFSQRLEGILDLEGIPLTSHLAQLLPLIALYIRTYLDDIGKGRLFRCQLIEPHDYLVFFFNIPLILVGARGDLLLHKARFNRLDGPPSLVYLLDVFYSSFFDLLGKGLEGIGTTKGIDDLNYAALMGNDLLGPQGDGN